jgi:hypothetical protein
MERANPPNLDLHAVLIPEIGSTLVRTPRVADSNKSTGSHPLLRRRASKVMADAKQGCAGDLAIMPYDLVITTATPTAKDAELAR